MRDHSRLDPDELLKALQEDDRTKNSGQLRVFLGMSAGVGKTYAMLKAAHKMKSEGKDIVIGLVETHGRSETAELLQNLELIPRKTIHHKNINIEELDLDAILERKPDIVIVDELPHTNTQGMRHEKRYQDVLEILNAGIDVFSALNVQHLESRKDAVESITGIRIRETVPDSILERASLVELVDIAPSELLKRLTQGKVYLGDKAKEAANQFFKEDKLTALREIALRFTAERVDQDLQRFTISRDQEPWQTNERILVAVSHSPHSEKLIRAARRLAYNLEAPWIAVHIDTGVRLNDKDQWQLAKNLQLARELKAEVITTIDTHLPNAIRRIARQKNVTQVIVGRPTRRWFRDLLEGGSLLSHLVKESQEVDIHIIRTDRQAVTKPSLMQELYLYRTQTGFIKYWNALWFLFGVTLVSLFLEPYLGYRVIGFIYLLAVLVVGLFGSIGAVLFAAALSAFGWDFIFINPKFTFTIAAAEDLILCVAYFAVALIVGFLTNRIRFHEKIIREREERMEILYRVLKDITDSPSKEDFLQKVKIRLGSLLDGECGFILKGSEHAPFLNEKEKAVADWSFQNQKQAGWSTETLSQASAIYIPLNGSQEKIGIFLFKPNNVQRKLDPDQENLIHTVIRQVGLSLERHLLSQKVIEAQRLEDSEKLQQTILSSISHELRTPLTGVLGSAAALESDLSLTENGRKMVEDIQFNGERLNRVIENLLDMSRISSGTLALKLEWHDLSDLVGVILKKLERPLVNHQVQVEIQDHFPMLKIDFRLFEHALFNLILNAAQYTSQKTQIFVKAKLHYSNIQITIEDQGNGISEEYVSHIFDKFYRVPGSLPGGTGLGLSIVKNIIELHKGHIYYERSPSRGSKFIIELPLEDQPKMPKE